MKKITKTLLVATMSALAPFASMAGEKPEVNFGLLVHTYGQLQQAGYGADAATVEAMGSDAYEWEAGFNVSRTRFMASAALTDKDFIFVESEITAGLGLSSDKAASIRILDAQYDHTFCDEFGVSAGKILVSYNRNGLQTASTLMANNFSDFQYAYSGPLQCDAGRDIGVNFYGGFFDKKLQYRLGLFNGKRDGYMNCTDDSAPLRFIGRLTYNFLDLDKYSGTNLGEGKTFTIGAGVDTQGGYVAYGVDTFFDHPMGSAGSITLNAAYSHMTGGDEDAKYSLANLIPTQNISFVELGYYFKDCKLQPWVKFEQEAFCNNSQHDKTVYGGGLSYFFNGYGTNLRASYIANNVMGKTFGQVWLQLQVCVF